MAVKYLTDLGYEIIGRNFRSRFGEIDIIASKDEIIHFIEVKYRKNIDYGYPAESVTRKKQSSIIKTSEIYMNTNKNFMNLVCTYDVISICGKKITHIENAFGVM